MRASSKVGGASSTPCGAGICWLRRPIPADAISRRRGSKMLPPLWETSTGFAGGGKWLGQWSCRRPSMWSIWSMRSMRSVALPHRRLCRRRLAHGLAKRTARCGYGAPRSRRRKRSHTKARSHEEDGKKSLFRGAVVFLEGEAVPSRADGRVAGRYMRLVEAGEINPHRRHQHPSTPVDGGWDGCFASGQPPALWLLNGRAFCVPWRIEPAAGQGGGTPPFSACLFSSAIRICLMSSCPWWKSFDSLSLSAPRLFSFAV